jgi:RNA polymerase sigma-70 factor (ECF subfamily)
MYVNDKTKVNWVLALRYGNLWAFNELFDRYENRLCRLCFAYLKSAEIEEEIVQEVLLKIWNNREELFLEKSFESYLFTIAKNGISNTIRKSKSEQAYLNYTRLHPGKNVLLDDELDFNELDIAYQNAIEQLSPRRKDFFIEQSTIPYEC